MYERIRAEGPLPMMTVLTCSGMDLPTSAIKAAEQSSNKGEADQSVVTTQKKEDKHRDLKESNDEKQNDSGLGGS